MSITAVMTWALPAQILIGGTTGSPLIPITSTPVMLASALSISPANDEQDNQSIQYRGKTTNDELRIPELFNAQWVLELISNTQENLAIAIGESPENPVDRIELLETPITGASTIGILYGEYQYELTHLWSDYIPLHQSPFRDQLSDQADEFISGFSITCLSIYGTSVIGLHIEYLPDAPQEFFPRQTNHVFCPLILLNELMLGDQTSVFGPDVQNPIGLLALNPNLGNEWDPIVFPNGIIVICSPGVIGIVAANHPDIPDHWNTFLTEMEACWDNHKLLLIGAIGAYALTCILASVYTGGLAVPHCLGGLVIDSLAVGLILERYRLCCKRAADKWNRAMRKLANCP